MDSVADTGFVYAVIYPRERFHAEARALYLALSDRVLLPAVALVELAFLADRAGGTQAIIATMQAIRQSRIELIDLIGEDYDRAVEILTKYSDTRIDFVDACIMALAERLNVTRILTFDRRDFGLYRPAHCEHFELLP
jgi:predicted nucleic acid-binding protein